MGAIVGALLVVAGAVTFLAQENSAEQTAAVARSGPEGTVPPTSAVVTSTTAAPVTSTIAARTSVKGAPPVTSAPAVATTVPGVAIPPKPGTYRYRYSGGTAPVEGALVVTAGPGAGRQTHTMTAAGQTDQTVVLWSGTARRIVSAGTNGSAAACTWAPELLSVGLPLTADAAWRSDATCTPSGAPAVRQTEDARVQGPTRTLVAGNPVDVWIVARHTLTEVQSGRGKAVIEAQSSEMFAPSLGLVVYQVVRTAVPQADGKIATTTQILELLDTQPG